MTTARIRKTLLAVMASFALSMAAMTGLSGVAHAQKDKPGGGDVTGCPYGAVCVYPNSSWNNGNPTYVFYSYGAHRIYGQYGAHRVYNNQYGGAKMYFCTGSNGTGCGEGIEGWMSLVLDPINSIKLTPN